MKTLNPDAQTNIWVATWFSGRADRPYTEFTVVRAGVPGAICTIFMKL